MPARSAELAVSDREQAVLVAVQADATLVFHGALGNLNCVVEISDGLVFRVWILRRRTSLAERKRTAWLPMQD
jgi:hypothetical protein